MTNAFAKTFPLFLCLSLAACAGPSVEDVRMTHALNAQGKALLAQGKNAEARDIYLSATSRDENNARAWNGLGVAYDLLGEREMARDAYLHARHLVPNDPLVANNLAHVYLEEGETSQAIEIMQPFADDPNAPQALKENLANALRTLPKTELKNETPFADLGSFPTEGQAKGHIEKVRALLDTPEDYIFTIVTEVKVIGGTPVFSARAKGKDPQSLCEELMSEAIPCRAPGAAMEP